jgi:hypothetical protein
VYFAFVTFQEQQMPDYRAYTVGPDGHFKECEVIIAEDDEKAIKIAERLVAENVVEVWHMDRKVAVLPKN